MSVFHNNALIGASGQAGAGPAIYSIERSLRFNSADSAYLSRTPASAGNRKTFTFAAWIKLSKITGYCHAISAGPDSNTVSSFSFSENGNTTGLNDLSFFDYQSGGYTTQLKSTAVFRDPSSWYHIVLAVDTTQSTASNRIKIYVNGAQITSFATATYPSQNTDLVLNDTVAHLIGTYTNSRFRYSDAYLADVHFIDGQALDPTSFGEFDTNGVWQPIAYTGTYGTNGFHLPFSDNSTAAALGTDTSGNGNTWTVNNISVTAGSGNDSLRDSPTNGSQTDTGVGGEVVGNYATLNPLAKGGDIQAPTNGNLQVTSSGSGYGLILGTIGMSSGKWYWEVTTTSANCATGIATNQANLAIYGGADAYSWVWASYSSNSLKRHNNTQSSYGSILASGDVVGVAFDADNGTLTFYKNNVSQGDAYTGIAAGTYLPVLGDETVDANIDLTVNFGQRPFAYTAPSGFKALCTTNLTAPTIADGSTAMDVALYTGNGSTQTISGLNFSPDLVWVKQRDVTRNHQLVDTVRGATLDLRSNTTDAETTTATGLTTFTSDGFSLGADAGYNVSSGTYVAWTWDAGSSTVTNTDGSITSQVRANPSAGFSVATLTTPSSGNFTVGHGLNIAPSLVICKARNQSFSWLVYHKSAGAGNYLVLNTTAASAASSTVWQNTDPSSTLVYGNVSNWGTADYVMYSFAPVAGYSSFGSYTGNGSADGPFVYTGFRPRWILLKASSAAGAWILHDTARTTYNVMGNELRPDDSTGEYQVDRFDLLSNGFKVRSSNATLNTSSSTYVWAAFAEHPFQTARAR